MIPEVASLLKVLFLCMLVLVFGTASAFAQEAPCLEPIVHYDFGDPENLGRDARSNADLVTIGNVTQGMLQNGVHTAVFDGKSALAQIPLGTQDVTDFLEEMTITIWAKHPARQVEHSFLLGTGCAYSVTGLGMGYWADTENFITALGGTPNAAYHLNFMSPGFGSYKTAADWNFYTLSVSRAGGLFAVNGVSLQLGSVAESGLELANFGLTLTLGAVTSNDHSTFYNYFLGELADVRIYDTALDADAIAALYALGPGGKLPLAADQPWIVSAGTISDPLLTATATTPDNQILGLLAQYSLPFTTSDGAVHVDGRVVWTRIVRQEDGVTVYGTLTHPDYPNPDNVQTQVFLPFGSLRSIQLPTIFADGMVLQRHENVRIFGIGGEAGDRLTVDFAGQTVEAVFSNDAWEAILAPMEACAQGRPLTLTYTRQGETEPHQVLTIDDVLVGEVWLASGQSNMEISLQWMIDSNPECLADYQQIDNWDMLRFYRQGYGESSVPVSTYDRLGYWEEYASTTDAAACSGMVLAYATHLQTMLGEDVPVGVVISAVGGACIEEWLDEKTMASLPSHAASMDKKDCRFYNAMIHPIEGYTIRGILWDQGEANAMWPEDYQLQFAAYAALYREKFHDADLPIIVTQLPQYDDDLYPVFRGAQWELMEQVEHVYTVCAIDLGNPDDVHPTDKYPFGERAAGAALAMVYGQPAVAGMAWGLSPEITGIQRTEGGLLLTVSGAEALTGPEEIEGFMVMANQRWAYVSAELRGNQIFVACDADSAVYINFLQDTSFPEMEFVRNEYGLPLAPMTYTSIPE